MFVYSLAIFLDSLVFSLGVLWLRMFPSKKQHAHSSSLIRLDGFTDGIFLGIGLFDFVPHALESAHKIGINGVFVYAGIVLGMQLIYATGSYFSKKSKQNLSCQATCCPSDFLGSQGITWPALIMLGLHALIEGMALGIIEEKVFQALLFSTIFLHKGLESMAFANAAYNSVRNKYFLYGSILLFAALTPSGIYLGQTIIGCYTHSEVLPLLMHMISASMFISMGLHCMLTSKIDNKHLMSVFAGLVTVASTMIFFHQQVHHHHEFSHHETPSVKQKNV